jgi:hypothetical protein
MSSPVMVIGAIHRKRATQRSFAEDNEVAQTLAAYRANKPFQVSSLLRRPWRGSHRFDAHCLYLLNEAAAKDAVSVAQQIAWCFVHGKASRSSWAVHSAVGCAVTPKWRMRRRGVPAPGTHIGSQPVCFNVKSKEERRVYKELNSAEVLIQRQPRRLLRDICITSA